MALDCVCGVDCSAVCAICYIGINSIYGCSWWTKQCRNVEIPPLRARFHQPLSLVSPPVSMRWRKDQRGKRGDIVRLNTSLQGTTTAINTAVVLKTITTPSNGLRHPSSCTKQNIWQKNTRQTTRNTARPSGRLNRTEIMILGRVFSPYARMAGATTSRTMR